ncbi:MAG: hypothetical protein H9W81_07765 [Enterococcus sp.]|nr:hypothetical protein [Enterococcus sp.]
MARYQIEVSNNGVIEEIHQFDEGSNYIDTFKTLIKCGFPNDVFVLYRIEGDAKAVEETVNYNDL